MRHAGFFFAALALIAVPSIAAAHIGRIDAKSGEVKLFEVPATDFITRVDTKSGQSVNYLLPQKSNIRRVYVDNSTTPVTFWVGSNHGASIVKLEPLG